MPVPLEQIPEGQHALLVLPFTPALLTDVSPLLPTIYSAVRQAATHSLTVLFSTPGSPTSETQLYATLAAAPKAHWNELQHFLGRVYATLAAGQWAAGRVLADVEVRFEGEAGEWADKLLAIPDNVLLIEGNEDLASSIIKAVASSAKHHTLVAPTLPAAGTVRTPTTDGAAYPVSAVGGTFDHLHAAHKLLLHISLFITGQRLICGVMADKLLKGKSHAALVEPLETRLAGVLAFLNRCGPAGRQLDVVEIEDALGPTRWDPEITALTVSGETVGGGDEVNRIRQEGGLGTLEMLCVDVISSTLHDESDEGVVKTLDLKGKDEKALKELKMGSTAIRQWMDRQRDADQETGS